jgi:hypothetical protein
MVTAAIRMAEMAVETTADREILISDSDGNIY